MLLRNILLALAMAFFAVPANAHLEPSVRAMVDAAIATGDAGKVDTIIEIAKLTNPKFVEELDGIHKKFREGKRNEQRLAKKRREEAIKAAGVFELWSGEIQAGGSHATGNSETLGLNGALKLKREGLDWTHLLNGRVDYQRNGGKTRREQYNLSYEPRYQIRKNLFAYGLAQFERDQRQGFDARYAVSGGLGYHVIDRANLDLAIKAGPALRRTEYTAGGTDNKLAALMGLDFDWEFAEGLKLTQDTNMVAETGGSATVIVDSSTTTLDLTTGLQAKISDRMSTRLSYQVEYDSNPPPGAVSTDTTSRFSLVYGF